jgi:hypothetical protein
MNTKKTLTRPLVFAAIFLVFCFALPQNTLALSQDAAGAVNLAPYVQPILKFLFDTALGLLKGVIFVVFSAYLLQTAIDYSPQWINVYDSLFVKTGLTFTTAVADILLILVFIAIAIGYVFKIETFNSEKALPKFFITALLIHFAPMFVAMLIDISNILLRSVMVGKEGLFTAVFGWTFAKSIIFSIGALIAPYTIAMAASIAGSVGTLTSLGFASLTLLNLTIGMPNYLMQTMVADIMGGILFTYAIFFLTRVFMIQLLAVLAPLAILAGALPQTKKYYDMWIEWLVGWAIGGVLVVFLLTLGLTCMDMLGTIPNTVASIGIGDKAINWFMQWHFYWIAIAIYMMAVEAICLAAVPALAKQFSEKLRKGEGGVTKLITKEAGKRYGSSLENRNLVEKDNAPKISVEVQQLKD